jgi:hypothetical protein
MPSYVYVFHGGASPNTKEESERLMAAWGSWMQRVGSALIDPGAPANSSKTVHANGSATEGGGVNPVTGYTIVEAVTFDDAVSLTAGCPIFDAGGSIEILEM